ncbi:ankyrin repeat domain-containing protein 27-like [Stegodyphus dumicola]|uniref:ankyrin repeat domain-containing protein 27-like n=1 Tax=Stegodyphus dumicola TaxID=202533 RepID=UPI0015AFFD04|nr:ankyrin repeat domain-containing protein 27-like [Stegodyphus dumicola]
MSYRKFLDAVKEFCLTEEIWKFLNKTKFVDKFKELQRNLWLICVPCGKSLKGLSITQDFVDYHVLKPSPFFKSHFITTDANSKASFEIDEATIKTPSGSVKILMEETAYNEDYKPYRILVIERPLCTSEKKVEFQNADVSNKDFILTEIECTLFLESFPGSADILKMLDKKIRVFNSSYMVLPQYLEDAASKLRSISCSTAEEFSRLLKHTSFDLFSNKKLSAVVENYVLCHVHDKVFPVIKKYCLEEDKKYTKLYHFRSRNYTVVELASLNSRNSPSEKLNCLMTTLELLNQDIEHFLFENCYPVSKDTPRLTSDDLIPLLVGVIIQARPQYLVSNLYYMQNFCWEMSSVDKYGFSLVTFQAAKEYVKCNEFDFLKPSSRKIKKELSLGELMEVAVEMQNNTKPSVEPKPAQCQSPIDHQLENVTKMIEASTRELREWTHPKDSSSFMKKKITKINAEENVGDFLSSLRQSSLGISYGKQS